MDGMGTRFGHLGVHESFVRFAHPKKTESKERYKHLGMHEAQSSFPNRDFGHQKHSSFGRFLFRGHGFFPPQQGSSSNRGGGLRGCSGGTL